MASIMVIFMASGIWGVYWSVVNTYHVEQKGMLLQAEGDRILDLIVNGGHVEGKQVYGLNSAIAGGAYPIVGPSSSGNFVDRGGSCPSGCDPVYRDDYRIEFQLDSPMSGNTRFAQFVVELYECDCHTGTNTKGATAVLWFDLRTEGTTGEPNNYSVKLSENLIQRSQAETHGTNEHTWFKVQKLPDLPNGICLGLKVSFYLADTSEHVKYCCILSRQPDPPIGDEAQRRAYMNSVPYPKYFSTTVYFPSRN
ncbi:MAG: hypothetical protein AB1512_23575 [Thermodesulfobacteriota bacterium]